MWGISYWTVPLFSSLVWLSMLIAMLVSWVKEGSPRYPSMEHNQHIAYISDVGAQHLKPLFIAMSAVTVVTFDLSFIFERWLRHTGRLAPNTSWWQKSLSLLSIIAAIAGAAGLILLSIFDTLRHPRAHDGFLILFLAGYIISAICICIEYQRLGVHHRENSVLRYSFYIKLMFIIVEVALAIAFGVTGKQHRYNTAAVLEWVVAFIFFFYVLSFFIDFMPAVRTKHHQSKQTEMGMADAEAANGGMHNNYYRHGAPANGYTTEHGHTNGYPDGYAGARANGYTNGHTNGYTNGHTNGYTNGTANGYTDGGYTNGHVKPSHSIPASQNF
ncbi:hypothetical protein GQ43DRAFT_174271 [Delitschia confertaspora ATCC 74209]|uniref:CWH43-like N-terminal domain-containing protein n=1 Tax=Delitschia confertaspora ATCC 74209 TaxID=1513339 RepID=A0A9P4JHL5_9PLEO|nr:hypothetical protein GQ43DRAFT_174271 [Delitschia confertaspora ATCC 74209]